MRGETDVDVGARVNGEWVGEGDCDIGQAVVVEEEEESVLFCGGEGVGAERADR